VQIPLKKKNILHNTSVNEVEVCPMRDRERQYNILVLVFTFDWTVVFQECCFSVWITPFRSVHYLSNQTSEA